MPDNENFNALTIKRAQRYKEVFIVCPQQIILHTPQRLVYAAGYDVESKVQYRSKVWTHFFSFFKTAVEIGPVG